MSNSAAYLTAPSAYPLKVDSAPLTQPSPSQVLIKNAALAINPVDVALQRQPIFPLTYPAILGTDVAGTVEAVGSDVKGFKKGDRVLGYATMMAERDNASGGFQRYTLVPQDVTSIIPDDLSFEQAAVLPLALATAAFALFTDDGLKLTYPQLGPDPINEYVLIWGGATSVGGTAIQLAKASGYQVVTTASPRNHEYIKSLGADHVFDYKSPDVVSSIVALLKNHHLAGTFEASGSSDSTLSSATIISQASGSKKLLSVREAPENLPEGIITKNYLAYELVGTEAAKKVFWEYVPKALEKGALRAEPKAEVVGKGLESVQKGVDVLKEGVSAKKIVVSL